MIKKISVIRDGLKFSLLRPWFYLAFLLGCATGREVNSQIDTRKYPVVQMPIEFQSPIAAIKGFSEVTEVRDPELLRTRKLAITELISQQEAIAKELKISGKLELKPGFSYEFTLESFCINAGIERPVEGDGLFLGDLKGSAKSWLPKILSDYRKRELSQNEAQVLIWSLLSGSRFNEMSSENQRNLMRIFPDAPARFGHSLVEDSAQDFLLSQVPSQILDVKEKYDYYRNVLQDTQSRFPEIERVLSPEPQRKSAIPVGWVQHEKGYFIRLKSDGYQRVHVQIYSPESIKPETYFEPSAHVALPGEGQRLSLTSNVLDSLNEHLGNLASDVVKMKTGKGLTEREKSLTIKYPLDALKMSESMKFAIEKTNQMFPKISKHNTKADAFRHFVWSGMSAYSLESENRAMAFLEAHEDSKGNPEKEKAMDMYNNLKGVEFFRKYRGNNFEEALIDEGLRRIESGELKWLR